MELKGYEIPHFDRGASRVKELLWFLVRFVFFANALPWPSFLRVALLRFFGATVGQRVVVRSHVNITFPWRLRVGDDVWLGDEVLILSLASVVIESSVCISPRAFLCTGSHRFHSPGFDLVTKPITVHRGSWIAAQAFIAPGIEIGPDSMVCAGSVVLQNVPPGAVVRGNPACEKSSHV
ncbi:MAG: WcaF family extracellular polysaccharide biosynthesis acetyltransferase [Verrucomicrobia bacterium]|nr:WcaF family extracellular polysaccharide biosynthesis acetyltransferase [Verrucomicrobiota bacterium]